MVYIFTEIDTFSEAEIDCYLNLLPPRRQERVNKYKFFKDRRLSVLAYLLLLYAAKQEQWRLPRTDFSYGINQKPYFSETPTIHFNLSHCSDGIACILSDTECGIDIQEMVDTILPDIFSEREKRQLDAAEDKKSCFTAIWTRKEAYCKYLGCGLKTISYLKECLENIPKNIWLHSQCIADRCWVTVCSQKAELICRISSADFKKEIQHIEPFC